MVNNRFRIGLQTTRSAPSEGASDAGCEPPDVLSRAYRLDRMTPAHKPTRSFDTDSKTGIIAVVSRLRETAAKINTGDPPRLAEPMDRHTSFCIGGPADLFIRPRSVEELAQAVEALRDAGIPRFHLGGGANILVADAGVRGAVIDLGDLTDLQWESSRVWAWAGAQMSDVAAAAAERGLRGLETFYSMPGQVGGSIWMNARCYEVSVSDVLDEVELLEPSGELRRVKVDPEQFAYKLSPFQSMDAAIVRGAFRLEPGEAGELRRRMARIRSDREAKGHFLFPSAGSVFKNSRAFGMPSGKLIDALGLRGRTVGGAQVSDLHANIIVNTGDASAANVLALVREIERRVLDAYGFRLERELLLVGDWGGE